jgi:hypothetical protein
MTSKLFDIGFDADLWKGLLGFEFDFFNRNRNGLVGTRTVTIPDWLGENLAQENINSDNTFGYDIVLHHRNTVNTAIGALQYGISPNVSFTRTYNVHIERTPDPDPWGNWKNNSNNRPNDIWWGYDDLGAFQSLTEIYSYPAIIDGSINRKMLPGDRKLSDWNGDGVVDSNDSHPIFSGNQSTPMLYYGLSLDLQFKGFDLTAVSQGGAMSYVSQGRYYTRIEDNVSSGPENLYDRWHMQDPASDPYNPNTVWIPGWYPTNNVATNASWNNSTNTHSILNDTYIRLKSIELGYTLPVKITDKIRIKSVRVYANAYNLLTLSRLKYEDPEHPSGNDGVTYPLMRSINFGINVKF